MKRYLLALVFLFSAVTAPLAPARAANTDTANWSGQGTYNAKDMVHIDSNYNLRLYNGSLFFGDNQLAPSTDSTQTTPSTSVGGYYGIKVPIKYVEAVTNGDVICSSNVATGNGRKCTTTGSTTVIGVADNTYALGAVGWMTVGGYALIKTTHTVAIGDILISTAGTAGNASTNNSASNGTVIGKALSTGAAAGANTLAIISLQ